MTQEAEISSKNERRSLLNAQKNIEIWAKLKTQPHRKKSLGIGEQLEITKYSKRFKVGNIALLINIDPSNVQFYLPEKTLSKIRITFYFFSLVKKSTELSCAAREKVK